MSRLFIYFREITFIPNVTYGPLCSVVDEIVRSACTPEVCRVICTEQRALYRVRRTYERVFPKVQSHRSHMGPAFQIIRLLFPRAPPGQRSFQPSLVSNVRRRWRVHSLAQYARHTWSELGNPNNLISFLVSRATIGDHRKH